VALCASGHSAAVVKAAGAGGGSRSGRCSCRRRCNQQHRAGSQKSSTFKIMSPAAVVTIADERSVAHL